MCFARPTDLQVTAACVVATTAAVAAAVAGGAAAGAPPRVRRPPAVFAAAGCNPFSAPPQVEIQQLTGSSETNRCDNTGYWFVSGYRNITTWTDKQQAGPDFVECFILTLRVIGGRVQDASGQMYVIKDEAVFYSITLATPAAYNLSSNSTSVTALHPVPAGGGLVSKSWTEKAICSQFIDLIQGIFNPPTCQFTIPTSKCA